MLKMTRSLRIILPLQFLFIIFTACNLPGKRTSSSHEMTPVITRAKSVDFRWYPNINSQHITNIALNVNCLEPTTRGAFKMYYVTSKVFLLKKLTMTNGYWHFTARLPDGLYAYEFIFEGIKQRQYDPFNPEKNYIISEIDHGRAMDYFCLESGKRVMKLSIRYDVDVLDDSIVFIHPSNLKNREKLIADLESGFSNVRKDFSKYLFKTYPYYTVLYYYNKKDNVGLARGGNSSFAEANQSYDQITSASPAFISFHETAHVVFGDIYGMVPFDYQLLDFINEGFASAYDMTSTIGRNPDSIVHQVMINSGPIDVLRIITQGFRKYEEVESYSIAASFVRAIINQYGPEKFVSYIRSIGSMADIASSFKRTYNSEFANFNCIWMNGINEQALPKLSTSISNDIEKSLILIKQAVRSKSDKFLKHNGISNYIGKDFYLLNPDLMHIKRIVDNQIGTVTYQLFSDDSGSVYVYLSKPKHTKTKAQEIDVVKISH